MLHSQNVNVGGILLVGIEGALVTFLRANAWPYAAAHLLLGRRNLLVVCPVANCLLFGWQGRAHL